MTEEPARILDFFFEAIADSKDSLVPENVSPQPERPHFGRLYGGVNNAYMGLRGPLPEKNYSPEDDGPSAA